MIFFPSAERTNWEDENTKLVWLPHKAVYEFASKYCRKKDVLDAGCGQGWGSVLIAGVAKKVIAIDIDEGALNFARKRFVKKNLSFLKCDLLNLNSVKKEIDTIICLQVIEHIKNTDILLKKIVDLFKKNGVLIISTPNRLSDHIPSPYHVREYSAIELKKLLLNHFQSVKLFGLYEDKNIKSMMDKKRQNNKLLLKIDILGFTRIFPKFVLSLIFIMGSKLVGILVRKTAQNSFKHLKTNDFKIRRSITNKAIDIIAICS